MTTRGARLLSWPGAAAMLCLLAAVLQLADPAAAHGGRDCDKPGGRIAMPAGAVLAVEPGLISQPIAHYVTTESDPRQSPEPVAGTTEIETLSAPLSASLVVLSVTEVGPAPNRHAIATALSADGSRITCVCRAGCGVCSSASCCAGAVLPTDLGWHTPASGPASVLSPVMTAAGTTAVPLPRPPNPLRLL